MTLLPITKVISGCCHKVKAAKGFFTQVKTETSKDVTEYSNLAEESLSGVFQCHGYTHSALCTHFIALCLDAAIVSRSVTVPLEVTPASFGRNF